MLDETMNLVHENSIVAISAIQQRFQEQSKYMFAISNLFDPRYAFLFYAPLVFSLDRHTGRKLMWVSVIAEWSNQVLKWMLMGERPYWWVHEAGIYNKTVIQPEIQQYFMTCETGPGSPSGHAMVTAAVFYILISALLRQTSQSKTSMAHRLIWALYTLILCVVSLSRIYLAAHFPHQCLLGAVIGVAVAILISNMDTDSFKKHHYIMGTAGMFATAMTTYFVIKGLGHDPLWSVNRAVKWCGKQEWVHIDTTPFFSMMRYCGFFLGMGLGLFSSLYKAAQRTNFTMAMKIVAAILAVGCAKASEFISLPKSNVYATYAGAFLISAVLPYLFIAVVPYVVSKTMGSSKKKSL